MKNISLKVENLSKSFSNHIGKVDVLSNINFELSRGEIIGIRGENGSGKTTLFNIIAGIEQSSSGRIYFPDEDIHRKPRINVVFQNYNSTLLPWLNVRKNICIPLKLANINKKEQNERLDNLLHKLDFSNLPINFFPNQLSGGQRQRVAIARALIQEPDILILDEPFSNLDNSTSLELQDILQDIHIQYNLSILLVSHNIDQVLYLADRFLVLGNHPSTIIKEFVVPFKRKRERKLILTKEFAELRNSILDYEYEKIR